MEMLGGGDWRERMRDEVLSNDGFGLGLHGDAADEALDNLDRVLAAAEERGEDLAELSFDEVKRRLRELPERC